MLSSRPTPNLQLYAHPAVRHPVPPAAGLPRATTATRRSSTGATARPTRCADAVGRSGPGRAGARRGSRSSSPSAPSTRPNPTAASHRSCPLSSERTSASECRERMLDGNGRHGARFSPEFGSSVDCRTPSLDFSDAEVRGGLRLRAGRRSAAGDRGAGRRGSTGATASRPCSASPGSGKSATIAWTIEQVQQPTLVIAPNKSLAAQLANEFREFFPDNRVEYFVCYYDYYQPEAYIAVERHLHREGQLDQRRDRPAAPLGHLGAADPARRDRRRVGVAASTAWARPRSTAGSSCSLQRGRRARPAGDPAPARRHAVRAQRHEPGPRQVPGAGRHDRGPPGLRGDRGADRAVRRRDRAASPSSTR